MPAIPMAAIENNPIVTAIPLVLRGVTVMTPSDIKVSASINGSDFISREDRMSGCTRRGVEDLKTPRELDRGAEDALLVALLARTLRGGTSGAITSIFLERGFICSSTSPFFTFTTARLADCSRMSAIGMIGSTFFSDVFLGATERFEATAFFEVDGADFLAETTLAARLETGVRALVEAAFFMKGGVMTQEWQNCWRL